MTFPKNPDWIALDTVLHNIQQKPILVDISLIIPTLGRPIFETCLAHVLSGSCWPKTLIVVHQGEQPEIRSWLNQVQSLGIQVAYFCLSERGKPKAINIAFKNTKSRFVCMIDDDCFVGPEWLYHMHRRLQANPSWIITGRVEPGGEETVAIVQLMDSVVYSRPRLKSDLFVGGNFGASMETIRLVGPFDEDPLLRFAAEDVEWGYRALRKRISIAYAPEVIVTHFGWRAEKERFERYRSYAYGHGGFYGKYLRRGDMFILLRALLHFGRALRRWMRGKVTGNVEMEMLGKAYCLGLLPGVFAGFRSQASFPKTR